MSAPVHSPFECVHSWSQRRGAAQKVPVGVSQAQESLQKCLGAAFILTPQPSQSCGASVALDVPGQGQDTSLPSRASSTLPPP